MTTLRGLRWPVVALVVVKLAILAGTWRLPAPLGMPVGPQYPPLRQDPPSLGWDEAEVVVERVSRVPLRIVKTTFIAFWPTLQTLFGFGDWPPKRGD